MDKQNMLPEWMEDEMVQSIPREKLLFLNNLFNEADTMRKAKNPGNSQKEMLLTLMPIIKKAKAAQINFRPEEIQAAIAAIRKHSSPTEQTQIDSLVRKYHKENEK